MTLNLFYSHFYFSGIRDVSKWSEKTKKPLETLYGYEYFAKTCEKWVDGIKQFKCLPDGKLHELLNDFFADYKGCFNSSPDVP